MEKKFENLSMEELIKLRHDLDREMTGRSNYVKLFKMTTPAHPRHPAIKAWQLYLSVVRYPDHRMPVKEFARLFEADRLSPWPLTPELAITLATLREEWGLGWKILSPRETEEEWRRLRELSYAEPHGSE